MKNVIYTITAGDYARAYGNYCLPSIESYAKANNCDFKIYDEKDTKLEYPTLHFILFKIFEDFEKSDYDRMLYVDADIIIHKNTPNIFEEFPKGTYFRHGHEWKKIEDFAKNSLNDNVDGRWEKYWSSGAIIFEKEDIIKYNKIWKEYLKTKPFIIGPWQGEMGMVNYFLAKTDIDVKVLPPRWHFTRVWADGYKGKSLADANVNRIQDIYFMHYAGCGDKVVAIEKDLREFGYMGYDAGMDNANAGVVVLSSTQINSIMNNRLDIEDNVGEGIHVHYKNIRLDFTIKDFIKLAQACDEALENLYNK